MEMFELALETKHRELAILRMYNLAILDRAALVVKQVSVTSDKEALAVKQVTVNQL